MRWPSFFHSIMGILRQLATSWRQQVVNAISYAPGAGLKAPESLASPGCQAVLDEMNSGRVPPYSIAGTMLLMKFRNEPRLFEYAKYEELFEVYHGKLASQTSDEIEVLFKENSVADHRILALSFLRDFVRRDRTYAKSLIFYFGSGWLEFGDVGEESAFFGETLSTMRTFARSQIEKKDYLGFIHRSQLEALSAYGQFAEIDVEFLGIQHLTEISDVLETYLPIESASYFRHPEDLSQTLAYVAEKIVEGELIELRDAFSRFKTFQLGEKNELLLNAYKSLLNLLIRLYRQNPQLKHLVSSCIAVSSHLLPPDCLDDELSELLNWCLEFRDLRVKANAVEALGHFDPNNPLVSNFLSSKFNRIASEALIIRARQGLSDELTRQILSFLGSANPFFVASGLYLVGFICEYHFLKDYEYFSKNHNFKVIVRHARVFKDHPHSIVRSRARMTLKQIDGLKGAA